MIENKDCKHYYQHYGYCKKNKFLHTIYFAHCLNNVKNKTCKDCQNFEPKTDDEENEIFSILKSFKTIEKSIDAINKELKRLDF